MCGICGAVHHDGSSPDERLLQQMNDTLRHRGPDGAGMHCSEGVGLAMRRLKIIDLSGSDQPLYNENRSVIVVFNGEIYNYQKLRHDLTQQGHTFQTGGDGETIVHLYEQYGLDAPKHLRGQFAFALRDEAERRLFLARDRFGQKPLYYYQDEDVFVFGSEIKALLEHPAVPRQSIFEDNPDMLALYLGYGYMPAPLTAFRGIQALMPGHILILEDGQKEGQQHPYWKTPRHNPKHAPEDELERSLSTTIKIVRDTLQEAIQLRLISDVPLGAFLSGGLDSSIIVALMQKASNRSAKTFSIGFTGDASFDESPYAEEVAQHLGSDHTTMIVEPHAMDLLEKLVWHHDQPFADSSAIPTFLVSELTRQHVTVALTGDGGDELFAGYERFYAATLVAKLGKIPRPLWKAAAALIGVFPEGTGYANFINRAGRFSRGASLPLDLAYFDWTRIGTAQAISRLIDHADTAGSHFSRNTQSTSLAGILEANQNTYLPDDLLIKADRCSMAASLEARAPFLDHHLAEVAAELPLNFKLNGKTTKYILKEAARGLLPDHIIDRKKHGFGVPLGTWLREDISPVKDLLLSESARKRALMSISEVEKLVQEHESGKRDHNRILWTLLTLEMWHRVFLD